MATSILKKSMSSFDGRLDISRDNELLQRFVRINLDDEEKSDTSELKPIKEEDEKGLAANSEGEAKEKSNKSGAGEGVKKSPKTKRRKVRKKEVIKPRRFRRLKHEEVFTDKDRAAAANMGTRDIKQDLKMKRKEDRSKHLHIPIEADPTTFLGLGSFEMKRGDLHTAMRFVEKVVEIVIKRY